MTKTAVRRSAFLFLAAATCLSVIVSCRIFRKPEVQKYFISAAIGPKQEEYRMRLSGQYDTAKHKIHLVAYDTLGDNSKMWVVNIELGPSCTLDNIQLPQQFDYKTAVATKSAVYAHVVWDNQDGTSLFDNYTNRRNSNLVVILTGKYKDIIEGSFSGTLFSLNDKVRIENGTFRVPVVRK